MARISHEVAAAEAAAICDRLDSVANLNPCSVAIIAVARAAIAAGDGRWAWEKADSAAFMHHVVTEMRPLTNDSISAKTMRADPTSLLYKE